MAPVPVSAMDAVVVWVSPRQPDRIPSESDVLGRSGVVGLVRKRMTAGHNERTNQSVGKEEASAATHRLLGGAV